MSMVGADVEQLRSFGTYLSSKQDDIESIISTVSGQLQNTVWRGAGRDTFEAEWEGSFKGALGALSKAFSAAGRDCVVRAGQIQDVA
ncbi:MAG: hypothetical protein ABW328_05605 [Ilumatobacteraceae bacterium]